MSKEYSERGASLGIVYGGIKRGVGGGGVSWAAVGWTREGRGGGGGLCMGGVHFRDWSLITLGWEGGGDKRHHRARAFRA